MGERTEMYYQPQMSPIPAEFGVEAWAADRAVELIEAGGDKPYFGFVSFVGPHPPFAPPIPFNRMYDPDRMPNPIRGDIAIDHMDEQIPWMNYVIWAEDINDTQARTLKARYYGEITYIDQCLGRILDAVEASPDADNTLICFFADHGDHMGDHNAWQKETFFEASCHVPFLVSWPSRLAKGAKREELVCLTDLFGMATHAAGRTEVREGVDMLGIIEGKSQPREHVIGYHCHPETPWFRIMVRDKDWKYIFMTDGGREQLFNVTEDQNELRQRLSDRSDIADRLRKEAIEALSKPNVDRALDGGSLRSIEYRRRPAKRIYQFDRSRGVNGFPKHPSDLLKGS
jgi:choline-sulfatase